MKPQSESKAAEEQLPGKVAPEKTDSCCFVAEKETEFVVFEGNNTSS